jgi:hypothetical protein
MLMFGSGASTYSSTCLGRQPVERAVVAEEATTPPRVRIFCPQVLDLSSDRAPVGEYGCKLCYRAAGIPATATAAKPHSGRVAGLLPVPERAATVRSRRSGRLPCRPARKPGHSGECPSLSRRDLPPGAATDTNRNPTSAIATAATRFPSFASDGQGARCRSPGCGASALEKKYSLRMLVYYTLLIVATCPAGTATRPPCPAAGRRAAQGRPKPAPAGFFSRLLRTLRGYPPIAPLPIRIYNRPFVAPSCYASRTCSFRCAGRNAGLACREGRGRVPVRLMVYPSFGGCVRRAAHRTAIFLRPRTRFLKQAGADLQ